MGLLLAFNGYLTIFGLVTSGVGSLISIFEPEIGTNVQQTGLGMAGVGATRKGVRQYKGL